MANDFWNKPMGRRGFLGLLGLGTGLIAASCSPTIRAINSILPPPSQPAPQMLIDPIDERFASGQGPFREEMYQVDFDYAGVRPEFWDSYTDLNGLARVALFNPTDAKTLETVIQTGADYQLLSDSTTLEVFRYLLNKRSITTPNNIRDTTFFVRKYGKDSLGHIKDVEKDFGAISLEAISSVDFLVEHKDKRDFLMEAKGALPISIDLRKLEQDLPLVDKYYGLHADTRQLADFTYSLKEIARKSKKESAAYNLLSAFGKAPPLEDDSISIENLGDYVAIAQQPHALQIIKNLASVGVTVRSDDTFVEGYTKLMQNDDFKKHALSPKFYRKASAYFSAESQTSDWGISLDRFVSSIPLILDPKATEHSLQSMGSLAANNDLMEELLFDSMSRVRLLENLSPSFGETESYLSQFRFGTNLREYMKTFNSAQAFQHLTREYFASTISAGAKERKVLNVLYPASGSHIAPFEIAIEAFRTTPIEHVHFTYTEISTKSLEEFGAIFDGMRAVDPHFSVEKPEFRKYDHGAEVGFNIAYGSKKITLTFALYRSSFEHYRQSYFDDADIVISHDPDDDNIFFSVREQFIKYLRSSYKSRVDKPRAFFMEWGPVSEEASSFCIDPIVVNYEYGCRNHQEVLHADHMGSARFTQAALLPLYSRDELRENFNHDYTAFLTQLRERKLLKPSHISSSALKPK